MITKLVCSTINHMKIKFENGSKIQSISSEENKRGYIRCMKLTDEEYKQIMFIENTKQKKQLILL